VKHGSFLDDSTRCEFIRSCVTCLQAHCGDDNITKDHVTELAKLICKEVPCLRDEKPPLWPKDEEFKYWVRLNNIA